jgi:hypothetical protein
MLYKTLTARFEVLTVVKMFMLVTWVVTLCGLEGRYTYFGGTYCLHVQICLQPKSWQPCTRLFDVTTRNTTVNIFTDLRTSNILSVFIFQSQDNECNNGAGLFVRVFFTSFELEEIDYCI